MQYAFRTRLHRSVRISYRSAQKRPFRCTHIVPLKYYQVVNVMSMYLAHAITALRKVKNREPLDECDVAIIEDVLTRLIQERRTPFQRHRDHYIIGTERFKTLDGLDYYRTILLKRKSAVWYPESDMSEVSVYEVHTGAQLEPSDKYSYNLEEHGSPEEQAEELKDRCQIGPCFSG